MRYILGHDRTVFIEINFLLNSFFLSISIFLVSLDSV